MYLFYTYKGVLYSSVQATQFIHNFQRVDFSGKESFRYLRRKYCEIFLDLKKKVCFFASTGNSVHLQFRESCLY